MEGQGDSGDDFEDGEWIHVRGVWRRMRLRDCGMD
jgi:hypothetical protein